GATTVVVGPFARPARPTPVAQGGARKGPRRRRNRRWRGRKERREQPQVPRWRRRRLFRPPLTARRATASGAPETRSEDAADRAATCLGDRGKFESRLSPKRLPKPGPRPQLHRPGRRNVPAGLSRAVEAHDTFEFIPLD